MKLKIVSILIALSLLFLLAGCQSLQSGMITTCNPAEAEGTLRIQECCYEVVIKKPVQDSLVYEKELPWDLVDINSRQDEYESIGTAFAISESKLITASHVFVPYSDSMVFKKRFIREKRIDENGDKIERIYEINNIVSINNHKDYVVFTVQDKTFDTWLQVNPDYTFNSKIFTAGNAYGEGVVIRDGMLLDKIPESENGEWNFLKSSSMTNPGNSGGPLLNENGQVIGIVLTKKDDFCYSLPITEVAESEGIFHLRQRFTFSLINDFVRYDFDYDLDDDDSVSLPIYYRDYIAYHQEKYLDYYVDAMDTLFSTYQEEMFPAGSISKTALHISRQTTFPQILLKDSDDKQWFFSNLSPQTEILEKNGRIMYQEIYENAGIWLIDIRKPDDMLLSELYGNSKTMMDYFLKGVRFSRSLYNSDPGTRILSFGEPFKSFEFTDDYKRTWKFDFWLQEFNDRVITMVSTPTPRGLVSLFMSVNSSSITDWTYDLQKIVNHVVINYSGKIENWTEFLDNEDILSEPLRDISLEFTEGERLLIDTPAFTVDFDTTIFDLDSSNILSLNYDFFPFAGSVVWDIRKIVYSEPSSDNYFLSYLYLKPDDDLPEGYHTEWAEITGHRHPFNEKPFVDSNGNSKIGAVHPYFVSKDGTTGGDYAYSIIVSRDCKESDETMIGYLEASKRMFDLK